MKKSVVAVFAGLVSAVAFAGIDNTVVVSFSSTGPDRYSDGELVLDNECYALVWTPSGSEFAGINADGTAVGDSVVALKASVARNHRCPNVNFQLDSGFASKYPGGSWGVYLLDTRRYATDEDGVILTDGDGKKIVESVGGDVVNGYGSVASLSSGSMASGSASGAVAAAVQSAAPASAANLKVSDIRFVGDDVYIYVTGSSSCLSYELKAGDKPGVLTPPADGKAQYGKDGDEMIIITRKKSGAQFFQVNRK